MKRIGITMRVDENSQYVERRDGLDQRWALVLKKCGLIPVPLLNTLTSEDAVSLIDDLGLEGLLLTGGNDLGVFPGATNLAPERDLVERAAIEHFHNLAKPVLGICRGMQCLAAHYGGEFIEFKEHVATRHAVRVVPGAPSFFSDRVSVNSYHRFGLLESTLPDTLQVLARSTDGCVEAIRHRSAPVFAVMWHPERDDPVCDDDLKIIRGVFDQ